MPLESNFVKEPLLVPLTDSYPEVYIFPDESSFNKYIPLPGRSELEKTSLPEESNFIIVLPLADCPAITIPPSKVSIT